jgi:opacity protein-like surface antigen
MSFRTAGFALSTLLWLVPAAQAQEYYGGPYRQDDRPVSWHVMGGLNQPVGSTDDILQSGWNVGGGVTFHQPRSPLALRLEIDYASNNATHSLIDQGQQVTGLQITGGWADIWSATANVELRMPIAPHVYGYLIGGAGAYYTRISLTQYGYGYVCDPWWNYCYPASGDLIVAEHDDTKFGWNAGAGIAFRLASGSTLFVEARYNAVQMRQTFSYVPVVVGLRF